MRTKGQVKYEIWGGFHGQMEPIRVWADDGAEGPQDLMEHYLSDATAKKVQKHMCGIDGCMCGINHGWEMEIV